MNDCITNDTPLVPGARIAPVGMSNGANSAAEYAEKFATKPRGNSLAGTTEFVLATKSRKGDQLARRVQPGLEVVEAARPILVVGHVVFSRPEQLHRHARQPGLRALLGDDARDLADLDVVVAVQTTAEAAARPHQVHRDLVWLRCRRRAPDSKAGNLSCTTRFPASRRGVVPWNSAARAARARGAEIRTPPRRPWRRFERRLGVADRGRAAAARGRGSERPARQALWPAPRSRRCFAFAAGPSSQSTFKPVAGVVGQPPVVGHDRHAASPASWRRAAAARRGLDEERVLDAGQPLHLVEVGADRLAAKHRALLEDREEHSRRLDVDAEGRLAGHDGDVVDALDRVLPMILKFFGSFSLISRDGSPAGIGIAAIRQRRVGGRALFVRACVTTPLPVGHSLAGTFHVCAAAVTIISAPPAPICRIGS